MRNQAGLTLTGFIVWAVLGSLVLLLALKIGPAYMEYMTIKKQFKAVAEDPTLRNSNAAMARGSFFLRGAVENMPSITNDNLIIEMVDGKPMLSAEYTRCEHIIANLRACMDFKPSSAN